MQDKPFLVSGRNTLIHKVRKLELLILNGDDQPVVSVTHKGLKVYTGVVPDNKRDAKMNDIELVDVTLGEVFSEEKVLIFVQTINGKEYKIDYSKVESDQFISLHQESLF
ncbi:hypothetical protein QX776_04180 [Alteromonadaceae bacterium BrNp21-10]|nr:hypothetical protein [Alteromonadaceae bacterium BrNp21-10]